MINIQNPSMIIMMMMMMEIIMMELTTKITINRNSIISKIETNTMTSIKNPIKKIPITQDTKMKTSTLGIIVIRAIFSKSFMLPIQLTMRKRKNIIPKIFIPMKRKIILIKLDK